LNRFVLKLDARNAIGAAASVSAASYVGGKLAPDSLVAAFGTQLATTTAAAASLPPPFELGGTAVTVRDSKGNQRQAQLLFVSPTQVNFIMPGGRPPARTETVTATITITNANGEYSIGTVGLEAVRPSIFTADSSGRGFAAVVAQRIRGNTFNYESVVRFDPNLNKFVAIPIDLGPETDQIFVELYGTGWRYRSSEGAVKVTIGGVDIPVTYAGLQPTLFGLDQINLKLPRALAGMGEVDLILTVDGEPANTTRINIK
jgi:uncharacterized protein (TIGR03437 family)